MEEGRRGGSRRAGSRIRRAAQSGERYDLPRLADLLARPGFEALGRFLAQRGVDVQPLQAQLEQLVEQARQEDGQPSAPGLDGLPPELQRLLTSLLQAAAAGQDIEPMLADLRGQLLQATPGAEQEINALLEELRNSLRKP